MDRHNDKRLPDELTETADWMRECRTEPTSLRLDELKQRAHRQAVRRRNLGILGGLATRWRIRAVTSLLVLGLMMSSLTGVVLATGGFGSSSAVNSGLHQLLQMLTKPKKDPSTSQYCKPSSHHGDDGHYGDDGHHGDDCDPCKSSSVSSKTYSSGSHSGGDDCKPDCSKSASSSKTSTSTNNGCKPPTTSCGSATYVKSNSATLNGSVNPNGDTTTAYFDYGSSTAFGSKTASQSVGNGTTAKSISAAISGLKPRTKYYCRSVAKNGKGTTNGATSSFTTAR
jgi:hypothetical protein